MKKFINWKFLLVTLVVVGSCLQELYAPCSTNPSCTREGCVGCPIRGGRAYEMDHAFAGEGLRMAELQRQQGGVVEKLSKDTEFLASAYFNRVIDKRAMEECLRQVAKTPELKGLLIQHIAILESIEQESTATGRPTASKSDKSKFGWGFGVFSGVFANRMGVPLHIQRDAAGLVIAIFATVAFNVLYKMSTKPLDTLAGALYNPFAWILKNRTAEDMADLAEGLRCLAFEMNEFLKKVKTLLAALDKAMNARQAGFDKGLPEVLELREVPLPGSVSTLEGFNHALESYLSEVELTLKTLRENKGSRKKFFRQIQLMEGLKREIRDCIVAINKITDLSDLTDQKKVAALNLRVMTVESLAMQVLKSLSIFEVTRSAQATAPRYGSASSYGQNFGAT